MFAAHDAEIPRLGSGFACRKFDDFSRDFLLPHEALARPQPGELALYLFAGRRHSLHARLILGREGVQPRTAKLRMHVVRGERTNENVRRQVQ